jgi:hypothetical protein
LTQRALFAIHNPHNQPRRNAMTSTTDASTKTKPAHKIRDGAIEVAIWRNDSDKGVWYSVTTRRSYKQNEEWKDADSYGQDDLLVLAKLLDLAHTWIVDTQNQQRAKQAA